MKPRFALAALAALGLAFALLPRPARSQSPVPTYTLTDIAAYGGEIPVPVAINASGQIVAGYGYRWTPSSPNSPSGVLSPLPLPKGASFAQAYGINNLGQAVGYALGGVHPTFTKFDYAELWQPNNATVNLVSGARALAINDAGEVVGQNDASGSTFLWINGKTYSLPGFRGSGINKSGQVCGWTPDTGAGNGGFLWTPSKPNGGTGTSIPLPLPAAGINDLGEVVGAGGSYLYTPGSVNNFTPLGGGSSGGINNKTQVVAGSYLWDSVNGWRSLNDPAQFTLLNADGWAVVSLTGINDFGQMVGWGWDPLGHVQIFLLTPH